MTTPANPTSCDHPFQAGEPIEEIRLAPPWNRALRYEILDSTQIQATRLLMQMQDLSGVILWAECQYKGRGRLDHIWVSHPGGLYVTVGLPYQLALPDAQLGWVSLLAAMALADALKAVTGVDARIKWPNDVYVQGRKVAGVLGETLRPTFLGGRRLVLIGLGVNWLNSIASMAEAGGFCAASIGEFVPGLKLSRREDLLQTWLDNLDCWQIRLAEGYNQALKVLSDSIESVLWRKGEKVALAHTEQGHIEGTLLGLGAGGAARLALEGGAVMDVHCGWQAS